MPSSLIAEDAGAIPVDAVTAERLPAYLANLDRKAADWLGASGFAAAAGEIALVPSTTGEGAVASVLFGLGKGDATPSLLAGKLATSLPAGTYRLRDGFADAALAALAFALGAYRFTRYRDDRHGQRRLVIPTGVDGREVARIADAVALARDLINTGPNDLGPAELAEAAQAVAKRHNATFTQIVGDALIADNFPLIHAVGAAAAPERAPRLIDIRWGDPSDPKVTLIGKGVVFDTGGLDIKPSSGMLLMKKDMGGAANALALADMIMGAGLKLRLRVLIPAVENAIAGNAFRPGDVFRSRKGLTVEIGNTDAEGRLILADALALAGEEDPALIVDLATLTGAARTALGPEVIPVYTADDTLAADLARHAVAVADPVWRMPLWAPYNALFESKIADLNNAGQSPFAGSITAALFLQRFIADPTRWLHADIYAWNPSPKPARPEGGEAQTIRALYALLKERHGR
ncbi:MAG TPA: leucyl aminopeptidase family protein [Bauldia sp.]|nr:leucyl aminopeptidase family protein [Bauldia sp.]